MQLRAGSRTPPGTPRAGVQRSTLKADENLAGLREHRRFRELMTLAWWTCKYEDRRTARRVRHVQQEEPSSPHP